LNPRLFAGCAAAAALLAGARLLWATLQSPFANGWDSYYFLAQFRGLWETGRFHTPDANLLYALLAPVYIVTGDAVLAYKLVLAASAVGLIAGIITLARRLDAGPIIALAAGIWAALSPTLTFLAFQFPRQWIGFALLVWCLYGLHHGDWRIWAPTLIAAFFAHRLAAAVGLAALATAGVARFRDRRTIWLGLAALALLAVASTVIPGVLNVRDWERLADTFQATPQWPPAAIIAWLRRDLVPEAWAVELHAAYLILAVGAGATTVRLVRVRPRPWFAWGISVAAFAAACPFFVVDGESAGYRLILVALGASPLIAAILLGNASPPTAATVGGALIAGSLSCAALVPPPTAYDPPYARYAAIADAAVALWDSDAPELIIAHKGLAELTTFRTGIPAMSWEPEPTLDPTRTWRIASDIDAWEITDVLGDRADPQPKRLPGVHAWVREDVWRAFRNAAPDDPNQLRTRAWSAANPSRPRPAFLCPDRSEIRCAR